MVRQSAKRTFIRVAVVCSVRVMQHDAHAASIYAPYVDVTFYPTPQVDKIGVTQGIQQFTLAFVLSGSGCTPSWGGVQSIGGSASGDLLTSLAASIASYRTKGGEVSVSFGGANGVPLMQACSSVASLKKAYQKVIDTYGLTHVDFDIEGAALQDTASVARNFQAVAQLQTAYAAQGKPLHLTLTLPVMPSGLTQDGIAVLDSALANKTTLNAVNVMAMDYGPANLDMGMSGISAAQALYSQLDKAYKSAGQTKSSAQLWQLVGVMPMIGMKDVQGETFTLANAQTVLTNAQNNGYGMLANWSVGRDQSCPNNGAYTAPTCSGIVQQPYAFASLFKKVSGHWGASVVQDAG
ncbi:Chitinase [Candidatus Paraburkholderia calva]|nr:Chitinase [Candidatus Paraburkholderia calva]